MSEIVESLTCLVQKPAGGIDGTIEADSLEKSSAQPTPDSLDRQVLATFLSRLPILTANDIHVARKS